MQNFYKGLMRCKDFMPFLKEKLIEHNWQVIDENMNTACWFVIQKLAADGGIMTLGFKEHDYPNFGQLRTVVGISTTDAKVGNTFTSAYDTVLHKFHKANGTYNYNNAAFMEGGDWWGISVYMRSPVAYFSTSLPDTEVSVAHVYYVLAFTEDGFCIKTRGNPALAGNITNTAYFGTFDNITAIPAGNAFVGCWGWLSHTGNTHFSRVAANGTTNNGWNEIGNYDHLLNYGYIGTYSGYSDLFYKGAEAYPVVRLVINGWEKEPLFTIPNDFILLCGKKANFADENIFLEGKGNTYIYTSPNASQNNPGFLIKAIDSVQDVSVIDTGSGYQIEWTNPTDQGIAKVAVYAKASGYPDAFNDTGATLIYENTNPILGAVESYIDTEVSRYGQTMHYAVVVFDANGSVATPDSVPLTPHASLITKGSRAKISNSIVDITSHPTRLNISYASYDYSNENKIHAYYNPNAVYSCNDNAANTVVSDSINNLHATASVNTSILTTPGKTGNALNLAGNNKITLPANALLKFPYSFTIQAWIQKPPTFSVQDNSVFATTDDQSEFRYVYKTEAPATSYFAGRSQGAWYDFPFPYNWTSNELHFITLQRRGKLMCMFLNSDRLNVGTPVTGGQIWNHSAVNTSFGSMNTSRYFNGVYEGIELYPYPLSHLQVKYCYNNGVGRTLTTADVVDGMAMIAAPDSVGERAIYKFDESLDLRNVANINLNCYSKLPGENFKLVFVNQDKSEFSVNCPVSNASTWENITLDISAVNNDLKKNITKMALEVLAAPDYNIFSIKNLIRA